MYGISDHSSVVGNHQIVTQVMWVCFRVMFAWFVMSLGVIILAYSATSHEPGNPSVDYVQWLMGVIFYLDLDKKYKYYCR